MDHEPATIAAFIRPEKREQYLRRLGSAKTRQKFMNSHSHHMRDLDERFAFRIPPSEQTADRIYETLRGRGAPETCYVISAMSDRDGTEADLRAVLREVVGMESGTFLSCIPGQLAYFEAEEAGERYILAR
jgi:hypothetical protein